MNKNWKEWKDSMRKVKHNGWIVYQNFRMKKVCQ